MLFWYVKSIVTIVFGIVLFGYVVLLHECGGLRGWGLRLPSWVVSCLHGNDGPSVMLDLIRNPHSGEMPYIL